MNERSIGAVVDALLESFPRSEFAFDDQSFYTAETVTRLSAFVCARLSNDQRQAYHAMNAAILRDITQCLDELHSNGDVTLVFDSALKVVRYHPAKPDDPEAANLVFSHNFFSQLVAAGTPANA